jgi:hypothetical protein
MAKNLLSRYIWIIDTIKRYGSITREELNERWKQMPFSDGEDLPRRTFYNYRNAIEELFKINIECNPSTFEYYIDNSNEHDESVTNWLLNSAALSSVLSGSRAVSDRIFLEDVPSAREYLDVVIDAVKEAHTLRFDYQPFSRINATPGILLEPYFLKLFRQRWYVIGRNVKEGSIKTYALDRIHNAVVMPDKFSIPKGFNIENYFRDSFGIVVDHSKAKRISIRTDSRQAKYLRALPLHHSQREVIHDSYSIFSYKLQLTPDLVKELLSYGPTITVLEPPELKAMMITSLKSTLAAYETSDERKSTAQDTETESPIVSE